MKRKIVWISGSVLLVAALTILLIIRLGAGGVDLDLNGLKNGGVVLTGGGARLQNVVSLARSIFGGAVRTGTLVPGVEGLEKDEFPPQLATIAGTLLLEQRNSDEQSIFDPLTSIFKKFFPGK